MVKGLMVLFVFLGSYFNVFYVRAADGCNFQEGPLTLIVPKMTIPADTPDGTVLYTSPRMTRKLICESLPGISRDYVSVSTTADFNSYLSINNGIRFSIFIDGYEYSGPGSNIIGYTSSSGGGNDIFSKDISIWYVISVDSSKGKIPTEGSQLSGSFQSIYVTIASDFSRPRGVISLHTPDITYIPCSMDVSVTPETIDFGAIKSSDLEKGKNIQKTFSTLIRKSKGCMQTASTPFGINMFFEPTSSAINPDGSLSLNNGTGLTISDSAGKNIAFNTAQKIDDVKVDSVLKNYFKAKLQKIAGQDIKTGPFSADVVVKLNYY
ncbi:fimbrial protein [Salmonella enterica subsp. enterica]|nr:fimbrial protein [Salmonella enterica subsp. enterica serovar Sandiego]